MKLFWLRYFFVFLSVLIILSCANRVPLTGGAEDKEAPYVVWAKPHNKQLNYKESKIILKFNEYVDLNQIHQNLTISPYSKEKPNVKLRGKKAVIDLKGIIKENTTYSLQANNAFKDYSAGNTMINFNLLFSTGTTLDTSNLEIFVVFPSSTPSSLTKVVLAKTKEDFFENNYSYISGINTNTALFNNIDRQIYKAYAFVDSNKNDKWDQNEYVGFLDKTVDKFSQKETISLFYDRSKYKNPTIVAEYNYLYKVLSFGENYNYKLDIPKNITSFNYNYDNYLLFDQNRDLDTIQAIFMGNKINIPIKKSTVEKPYISLIKNTEQRNAIILDSTDCRFYFSSNLSQFDRNIIRIKMDTAFIDSFEIDLKENYLQLNKLFSGKNYTLYLDSAAVTNGFLYSKKDSISFSTISRNLCHDSITIIFSPALSKNEIIYINNKEQYSKIDPNNSCYFVERTCDKEINFVIIEDKNQNGFWDTGSIYEDLEPEKKYNVKTAIVDNIIEYTITWKKE